MPANNKSSGGFTVFEIMVVISIFALLTAISIPFLNKYQPNLKLNSSARNLAADLRYAQQLTITEQVLHLISIDIGAGSYALERIGAATTTIKEIILPQEVTFDLASTTVSEIRFNSYGGVSGSSVGEIMLKNNNGQSQLILIKPSGYVHLSN